MRVFLLFLLFSISSCATLKSPNAWQYSTYSLDGQWQLEIVEDSRSRPSVYDIDVPGNWENSGIEHAGVAYYSRQFDIKTFNQRDSMNRARYWLDFDAVDYSAAVFVNGKYLDQHHGYFSPFSVEVTTAVSRKANMLNVRVNSPDEARSSDWSLYKTQIKGILNHHDTRPGGAWSMAGQDRNSGGIWGSVHLRETGPVAIKSVRVSPRIIDVSSQRTAGNVQVELDSLHQGQITLQFTLEHINPPSSQRGLSMQYQVSLPVKRGLQTLSWEIPAEKRALWWPWDWGHPNLYRLQVDALFGSRISDSQTHNVGFRTVRFDEDPGTLFVNEKPYFIRGTNYIASQWLGEVSKEDYEQDVALMKKAHINAIRVHAHVAGRALYRIADEQGMLIWQDFPLQWGYVDDPLFINDAIKQTKAMTDMLYNHASIAFWCGHNEPPWDADWMKYKYESYQPTQNLALSEAVFQQLKRAGDQRIVRKASYTREHPWFGWYSGSYKDYRKSIPASIVSEFGAQAMPDYEKVLSILNHETSWPLSESMIEILKYHNYQPYETLHIAGVRQGQSLSHFVKNSQEYQRLVTKFSAEQLRLKKGAGIAAIFQFMFVDSWPAITWSVLDVERDRKPGYFALQQAYQPIIAIADVNREQNTPNMSLSIVNDTLREYENVKVIVKDLDNDNRWKLENINLLSNARISVLVDQPLKGLSDHFSVLLLDKNNDEISRNRYLPQDR